MTSFLRKKERLTGPLACPPCQRGVGAPHTCPGLRRQTEPGRCPRNPSSAAGAGHVASCETTSDTQHVASSVFIFTGPVVRRGCFSGHSPAGPSLCLNWGSHGAPPRGPASRPSLPSEGCHKEMGQGLLHSCFSQHIPHPTHEHQDLGCFRWSRNIGRTLATMLLFRKMSSKLLIFQPPNTLRYYEYFRFGTHLVLPTFITFFTQHAFLVLSPSLWGHFYST